jgi:hypothetical protein
MRTQYNCAPSYSDAEKKVPFTEGVQISSTDFLFLCGASSYEPEISMPDVIAEQITSFAPEPYILKSSIHIKILGKEDEYTASHHESNIHASGDTPFEAIENLKSLMLDTFDLLILEPEENLGPKARHQRILLEGLIERV